LSKADLDFEGGPFGGCENGVTGATSHIITQNEPSRKQVWPVTDTLIAIKPLPISYVAPEHSAEEVGRQNIQQLIYEERLHIEHLLPILNRERDRADKALRCH
jgi:hypothetical protein